MPRTTSSADYSQALGVALRARRNDLALSQADVGRRLGVSTTYIQNLEAGRTNITVGQLEKICQALDAYPRVQLEPLSEPSAELDALSKLSS